MNVGNFVFDFVDRFCVFEIEFSYLYVCCVLIWLIRNLIGFVFEVDWFKCYEGDDSCYFVDVIDVVGGYFVGDVWGGLCGSFVFFVGCISVFFWFGGDFFDDGNGLDLGDS